MDARSLDNGSHGKEYIWCPIFLRYKRHEKDGHWALGGVILQKMTRSPREIR